MNPHGYFKVIAVGDVMLGEHPLSIDRGVLTSWLRYGKEPFEFIRKHLLEGDLVLGNLESVISGVSEKSRYARRSLRAPPVGAMLLKKAGFSVLSVANNHAMDHGPSAFERTCKALRENGIEPCGLNSDPVVTTFLSKECQSRIQAAIFGASFRPNQSPFEPLYRIISNIDNWKAFVSDVQDAANEYDIVILQCHWGDEFVNIPSPLQLKAASKLVDAGADIIIGHHPHVYQGMEVIKGKPVFYSLGNFVSDMTQPYLRRSAIAEVDVVVDCSLRPTRKAVRLDSHHRPRISGKLSDDNFLDRVDGLLSHFWKTKSNRDYYKLADSARARYRRDVRQEFLFCGDNPAKKICIAATSIRRFLRKTMNLS